MPHIELRKSAGLQSEGDLLLAVSEETFHYLRSSPSEEIRVSAYLDKDWPLVEAMYAEIYINEQCPFDSKVMTVSPGSRTRKVKLPGPMNEGEQLTIVVSRSRKPK